ncbi:hypothetical protein Dimus_035844 [Dionaea muscipula]
MPSPKSDLSSNSDAVTAASNASPSSDEPTSPRSVEEDIIGDGLLWSRVRVPEDGGSLVDQSTFSFLVFSLSARGLGCCCGLPWRFSSGGLAPPASPRRRRVLVGDNLTQPRRHRSRSLLEDCQRALRAVHPRMVWAFDSAHHREQRVRAVVERSLSEVTGSIVEDVSAVMEVSIEGSAAKVVAGPSMEPKPDLVLSQMGLSSNLELQQGDCLSLRFSKGDLEVDLDPPMEGGVVRTLELGSAMDADDDAR